MRTARILGLGNSYYHVMSRVVDRRFIFGELEKKVFRDFMRRQARFAGIEILTYSCMGNHFHILLCVPRAQPIDDQELERRLRAIHPPKPAEYRFCGYGEAVAGNREARAGLVALCRRFGPCSGWTEAARHYRDVLRQPEHPTAKPRARVTSELSREQALRIRVRYLTDGVVLGSRRFVDEVFEQCRSRFSPRRADGARKMKGADWGRLFVIRDLRSNVYG